MKLRHAAENGDRPDGTKRLGFGDSLATSLAAAIVAAVVPVLPFPLAGNEFVVTTLVITVVAAVIWLTFGLVTFVRCGKRGLWFLIGAPLALGWPCLCLMIFLYGP